jgi:hypothetical protein
MMSFISKCWLLFISDRPIMFINSGFDAIAWLNSERPRLGKEISEQASVCMSDVIYYIIYVSHSGLSVFSRGGC